MKVKYLIFGDGLLGNAFKAYKHTAVLSRTQCDIRVKEDIKTALTYYRPKIVINAAGIVPRSNATAEQMFKVNAFAPHYIADACYKKCKLIHISTDCVFSGVKGKYVETDVPDAPDMYGMSKTLGEPSDALVVRTSFVGLDDPKGRGLLAWASQQQEIIGYDKTFWNGITTVEMVKKLFELAEQESTGIRHIYSYTVSKYELLKYAQEVFGWKYKIYPESENGGVPHISDKTLHSIYPDGFIAKPIRQQLMELIHDHP
jgi:dTDP-4-dehydrorhamnose reductase